jgi:hypothetical protein
MSTIGTHRILATLAAATLVGVTAGSAQAFVESRNRERLDSYGDDDAASGTVRWNSGQTNESGKSGAASLPYLSSNTGEGMITSVTIFSKTVVPMVAWVTAEARWQANADGLDVHTPTVGSAMIVLGNVLFSSTGTGCGSGSRCVTAARTVEREFARESAFFIRPGLAIKIIGTVVGSVSTDLAASATATRLAGVPNTLDGLADARWTASAAFTVSFDTNPGDLEVVLDVTGALRAEAAQTTRYLGDALYSWINRAYLTVENLDTRKLWGQSGSRTCTDYRSRPSTACVDEL